MVNMGVNNTDKKKNILCFHFYENENSFSLLGLKDVWLKNLNLIIKLNLVYKEIPQSPLIS